MKVHLVLIVASLALAHVQAQTCGGTCTSSVECATGAGGDMSCRCQNFVCTTVADLCGGGCVFDSQCADWAGDEACVCSWLSCEMESIAKAHPEPAFLHLVNNIKTQKGREEAVKKIA